jgi:hypothetical protein
LRGLAVEGAILFVAEGEIDECVLVGGVQLLARLEDVELVSGVGVEQGFGG